MDVKTDFLNGQWEEEIYMQQSTRFVFPGHEKKVLKLQKSIHGQIQSSR